MSKFPYSDIIFPRYSLTGVFRDRELTEFLLEKTFCIWLTTSGEGTTPETAAERDDGDTAAARKGSPQNRSADLPPV